MIGIGATLFKVPTMHGGAAFSPASLFAAGEEGSWYDPADLTTLFQNSNGTTAVAVGDPVGYMGDKSGNGNHAIQATSTKRPTLQQDGSLYYLDFGGDDGLATSAIDFTGGDQLTVCAGARKDINTTMVVAELSPNISGNNGAFRLASLANTWRYGAKGTSIVNVDATTYAANAVSVLTGLSDISTPVATIRVDGVQKATSSTSQGTGNLGNYPLNIGARNNGGSLFLDGRIYGFVIRSVLSTGADLTNLEAYMAAKTGVTI